MARCLMDEYCQWCGFKIIEHPSLEHCQKMIQRALKRPRKNGDGCHHCGHSKKEHSGKEYTVLDDKTKILIKNTLCGHLKKGVRKDTNFDRDDFCECGVYL